jgi:hypothetical protein
MQTSAVCACQQVSVRAWGIYWALAGGFTVQKR